MAIADCPLNSGGNKNNFEPHETEDSLSGGGIRIAQLGTLVPLPCCFYVVVQKLITKKVQIHLGSPSNKPRFLRKYPAVFHCLGNIL